jgi:type I restriction enzyme R subunit
MTKAEEIKVKNAAKHLLQRLIDEKPKVLVQDWFKDSQTRIKVHSAIDDVLDKELPESYSKDLFHKKSISVYELIFNYAAMPNPPEIKAIYHTGYGGEMQQYHA